ncbi:hypothetical protein H0H93_010137 [Arthromyces matolae]|nr:hypothetical protein H0H93_010137 [Arthromyces matolae]
MGSNQPIGHSTPDFHWDEKTRGTVEIHILLEDVDVECHFKKVAPAENVQNIGLLIADEFRLVGGGGRLGPPRSCHFNVSTQTEIKAQIAACGVSLGNTRDSGARMGAPSHAIPQALCSLGSSAWLLPGGFGACIVQRSINSGAIQVLVASKDAAWSLPVASYAVIIMEVQSYKDKEHRYIDYPVMDALQMMGHACRTTEAEHSRCVCVFHQVYQMYLTPPIPCTQIILAC